MKRESRMAAYVSTRTRADVQLDWSSSISLLKLVGRALCDAKSPANLSGGNCELTRPGEKSVHNGVTIIGHTVSA